MEGLAAKHTTVVLYGEIYGPGIQSMTYGLKDGELGYAAFDIKVDGKFMKFSHMCLLCEEFGVPRVPSHPLVKYSLETVAEIASSPSLVTDAHRREGVVVRRLNECIDLRHGRAIMKYLSDEYLLSKKSDLTEE